jgi:signal peptidase
MTRPIHPAVKLAATAAVAVLVWLFLWPAAIGGSMTYVVVSGPSMEPVYETGDFVAAREQESYGIGDIVVFSTENGNVIHRIIGGDGDTGYVMQGDNNPEVDQWTPTGDEVLGKAALHVPDAGKAVMLVRQILITPPFPYLLAAFVFLVIVLGDDAKRQSAAHSDKDDDEADAPDGTQRADSNSHPVA